MGRTEEIMDTISMGTQEIIGEAEIRRKISEGKTLTIKLGLDPTAPDIHLGHTVVLRKIRKFQDLGHIAKIIIGDFTSSIGDPTGRSRTRPKLSEEEIIKNSKTYFQQIFKVLDREKTEILYNSAWLSDVTLREITEPLSAVTVARMMEREDFEENRSHSPSRIIDLGGVRPVN